MFTNKGHNLELSKLIQLRSELNNNDEVTANKWARGLAWLYLWLWESQTPVQIRAGPFFLTSIKILYDLLDRPSQHIESDPDPRKP